jgi:hypothetical protein
MDARTTLNKEGSFLALLQHEHECNRKVNLLVDQDGISRVSGFINNIFTRNDAYYIKVDDNQEFSISQIVAVNGIFSDDYTEC